MFSFVIGTIQIYDDDDDECGFGLNKTKQTKMPVMSKAQDKTDSTNYVVRFVARQAVHLDSRFDRDDGGDASR